MSPPLKKKQLGEVNRIHKKGGKRRMSLFSWAGPEREKKLGVGVEKVQETRLVNVQLVSPNHTA